MINGSTFGKNFRVTTFGESHGEALGVVIDGCPSELEINEELIKYELARRKPGQSNIVSPRKEDDGYQILSGIFEGKTTGAPFAAIFPNIDQKSKDYSDIKDLFRPGHADYTYYKKYVHRDYRGGGRSSARETISRVFAGAIAKQILATWGVKIRGGISQIGKVKANKLDWENVELNIVRSLDPDVSEEMVKEIEDIRRNRDSVGGKLYIEAHGVPIGLGEPAFQKLDSLIGAAMFSIPAVKGVEIGSGFSSVEAKGSENNDQMNSFGFLSNHHGGVLGGISSGAPICVSVAIKPTSSIPSTQVTVDKENKEKQIVTKGRHDPCVAIRAVPIAEAMLALILIDFLIEDLGRKSIKQAFAPSMESSKKL
jgi:chorismate synthase